MILHVYKNHLLSDSTYRLYYLKEKEKERGGYYGTDIAILAKELEVRWYSVQKRLRDWRKTDPAFANFHYLGKHRPSITLDEFVEMTGRISANPLEVKSHIHSDLNEKRTAIEKQSIPSKRLNLHNSGWTEIN
jgi:hypothetical protein